MVRHGPVHRRGRRGGGRRDVPDRRESPDCSVPDSPEARSVLACDLGDSPEILPPRGNERILPRRPRGDGAFRPGQVPCEGDPRGGGVPVQQGGHLAHSSFRYGGVRSRLLERRRRLVERMELFGPFVPKEIHRGNWLEALEFYRGVVLQSLVEALRMHYGPVHYDFRMRYVYRELPPDVLRRLERLAFVKDPDDLAAKYPQALAWFREAIDAVDERQVRRQIVES